MHLLHGAGHKREMTTVQSEKYVARYGSKYDEMRMVTASFVRVLQRCTGSLCMHFLLIYHEVRSVSKTCSEFFIRHKARRLLPYVVAALVTLISGSDKSLFFQDSKTATKC